MDSLGDSLVVGAMSICSEVWLAPSPPSSLNGNIPKTSLPYFGQIKWGSFEIYAINKVQLLGQFSQNIVLKIDGVITHMPHMQLTRWIRQHGAGVILLLRLTALV